MTKYFIISAILVILISCAEDFSIHTGETDARIVFAGVITDEEGPYFFRVSTSNQNTNAFSSQTGITDALVIIADNKGNIDTLKSFNPTIEVHPKWAYRYITFKKYSGAIDTIRNVGKDSTVFRGVYYTTRIRGVSGNKYTLYVKYKDKVITASDSMSKVPPIDSIKFFSKTLLKDGDKYLAPYIYFKEPQNEKNFYMMNFGNDNIVGLIFGAAKVWHFSIIDDKDLPAYVNGLNIDDGISPIGSEDIYYPSKGSLATIRLLSLSPGAYEFYKSAISQFENDGGAYTPSPTSPPTNLSGNALGFFQASAVCEKKVLVTDSLNFPVLLMNTQNYVKGNISKK